MRRMQTTIVAARGTDPQEHYLTKDPVRSLALFLGSTVLPKAAGRKDISSELAVLLGNISHCRGILKLYYTACHQSHDWLGSQVYNGASSKIDDKQLFSMNLMSIC